MTNLLKFKAKKQHGPRDEFVPDREPEDYVDALKFIEALKSSPEEGCIEPIRNQERKS